MGGFTSILVKHCGQVTGVDSSVNAVRAANRYFESIRIGSIKVVVGDGFGLCFPSESFDMVLMVDTIRYTELPEKLIAEAARLLRADGKVVIFEPIKYNIALYLMCLFDRNEWGVLKYDSMSTYRGLLSNTLEIERIEYSGLLEGSQSPKLIRLANFLSESGRSWLLKSQSPKKKIVLRKA